IHYDFYRLPDPGLMLDDLQENLDNPENIIIVEWGESVANILPENRIRIHITYNENGSRSINLQS
ncbi:tRNA (adenosine(37)-N6)-threonylcarbamoyltransferase complex ATPase subunit type 1 TsaE, partial [Candidatus Saccharibacteria bacterium]|nr:tRNA (adenosine(37)-N6)-threonylcarbamoyltransferase complex ATPase subunit type 1 TsaE [Candidatus Saccharibacteria bacterium]